MQFLTLLAGASAQIQIGSNALAPSEPASDAEHRRLISTTYPNVDFSYNVEGNNYLTDANTWEYSYLLNSDNQVMLYFYIFEVFHWPTRGKQFEVKCTFSATGESDVHHTILNPIDTGIDAPLPWAGKDITASCAAWYKGNSTQASDPQVQTIKTVSTKGTPAVVPEYTENDAEYAFGDNWVDIAISATCTEKCEETYPAWNGGVSFHPYGGVAPTFVPPVSLSFVSTNYMHLDTHNAASEYKIMCEFSALFGDNSVNRSVTAIVDLSSDMPTLDIDWSGVTVGVSCFLVSPTSTKRNAVRKSWSTYTEFTTATPNKENAGSYIADAYRPAEGSGLRYVRAYVAMPLDPWLWDTHAQANFKTAVLKTMLYEPAFQRDDASFCEAGSTCVTGNIDKVSIISYDDRGVYFQVETSALREISLDSGVVPENMAVFGIWTSTFVSCYFGKMLVEAGSVESDANIQIDTSQTFTIEEAYTNWADLATLAAWAIVLIVVPIVLFCCFLAIAGGITITLCVRKRKVDADERKNLTKEIELHEEEKVLHMNQQQVALEQKRIEEEKQKLDADRAALDERASAAEALDAQLGKMAAQKEALAAQIAGISAALGEGQGAEGAAPFDEAKAVADIEAAHAAEAAQAQSELAAAQTSMKERLAARLAKKKALLEQARIAAEADNGDAEAHKAAVLAAAQVKLQIVTDDHDAQAEHVAALEQELAENGATDSDELADELEVRKAALAEAETAAIAAEDLVAKVESTPAADAPGAVDELEISAITASLDAAQSSLEAEMQSAATAQQSRLAARLAARKEKKATKLAAQRAAAAEAQEAAQADAMAKIDADAAAADALQAKKAEMEAQLEALVGSTAVLKQQAAEENLAVKKQRGAIADRLKKRKERQRRLRVQKAKLDAAK